MLRADEEQEVREREKEARIEENPNKATIKDLSLILAQF